jgi:hypothetical protein
MQYERSELIPLAQAYMAESGWAASRLSREIVGHDKLFQRLFAGDDCLSESARIASRWFEDHWPYHLPWPAGIRREHGGPTERDRLRAGTRPVRGRAGETPRAPLGPTAPTRTEIAAAIAEVKAQARAAGLTDADIDAELTAYNAERR